MLYSFILFVWTASGCGSQAGAYRCNYDWRESGVFYAVDSTNNPENARKACEAAAQQLAIEEKNYRCIRSR